MQRSKTLLIWDCDKNFPDNDNYRVLWQSYITANPSMEVSIPKLVEDNADKLKTEYLSLIYNLGELNINGKTIIESLEINQRFSFWWMTLLNEKCNYAKSPQVDNIIKLLAFKGWIKNQKYNNIIFTSSNCELADSLQLLLIDLDMDFTWERVEDKHPTLSILRKIYNTFPGLLKATVLLLRYLASRWKLKGVGIDAWKKSSATLLFTSYFFNLIPSRSKKVEFKSRYWSKLPNLLDSEDIQSNWLHIYVASDLVPTTLSAKSLIQEINKNHKNQNHVFLDSFLNFNIVRCVIVNWLGMAIKNIKIERKIKKHVGYLWPLLNNDLKESLFGTTMMHNLLFYFLFREAMRLLPEQNKGVYLQENQGWEFGFISAWREFNHGEIIGVPHSTIRYWDLRYFFDPRYYKKKNRLSIPFPNKIGVNGEASKNAYINGGYPKKELIEVEALRYLQLEKIDKVHLNNLKFLSIVRNAQVLILGDYLQENNDRMLLLLAKANALVINKIKWIIKPHPACPILSQDYPELNAVITDNPIEELTGQCMAAYASSVTSAAVDVYYSGIPVITLLDPKKLDLSPLRGCDGVLPVENADELAILLDNLNSIVVKDKRGEGYFYLNSKLPRWRRLLVGNDS